jgi:hypothetical protein
MVASTLGGCAGFDGSGGALETVRTDSAGVEIVLNLITATAVPVFATADSVPSLRLGSLDGPPEEQFGEVNDAIPLANGGVAVLDGQAGQVRLFGSDGTYQMTLGAKGEGPGEFQSPISLALLPGDTLAVFDAGPRRITRFGLDGSLGRITTLNDTQARIVAAAFLPDGSMVGQSRWLGQGGGPIPGPDLTFGRDSAVLTVFGGDGEVTDTVDVVPGRETLTSVTRSGQGISVFRRSAAFGRTNVFAVHPDGVWSSENDRFELRLRQTEGGRLLRIVRAPELDKPIEDDLAQVIYDRALAEAETPDERRLTEEWYALSPRPDLQPAFDRLLADEGARLWIRAWSTPEVTSRWWVIERGGDVLGYVDLPSGLRVTSVRCRWVWGVEQDALDVSYVVRYALRGTGVC